MAKKKHPLEVFTYHSGGRGGIRTLGTFYRTPVFKTGTFNHSVTLPGLIWRRRGDSNSRYRSLRTNDLANRPLQPLGYSSKMYTMKPGYIVPHLYKIP